MLPHVEQQDGNLAGGQVALVIEHLEQVEALAEGVIGQHAPAGALHAERVGVEGLLELLEAAEGLAEGVGQVARGLAAAVGRHVLPEHRVVDVAAEVEGQVLLELVDGAQLALGGGFGQLLNGGVGTLHIGRVVLAVMEFHDLGRDMGGQRVVVVIEIRQFVGHYVFLQVWGVRRAVAPHGLAADAEARRTGLL